MVAFFAITSLFLMSLVITPIVFCCGYALQRYLRRRRQLLKQFAGLLSRTPTMADLIFLFGS